MRRPNIHRPGIHTHRVCPHIGIRGVPPRTSTTADWNKRQFAGHAGIRGKTRTTSLSPYWGPHPDNEPVTLFASVLDVRASQAACIEWVHSPWHLVGKERSGGGAARIWRGVPYNERGGFQFGIVALRAWLA